MVSKVALAVLSLIVISILLIASAFIFTQKPPQEKVRIRVTYSIKLMNALGNTISNVNVTLLNDTKIAFSLTKANSTGWYNLGPVDPGPYTIEIMSEDGLRLYSEKIELNTNKSDTLTLQVQDLNIEIYSVIGNKTELITTNAKIELLTDKRELLLSKDVKNITVFNNIPYGNYSIKIYWLKVPVIEDNIKLDGSKTVFKYNITARKIKIGIFDQNKKPLLNADLKIYHDNDLIFWSKTKNNNILDVLLPIEKYNVSVEINGIKARIIDKNVLNLLEWPYDTFNVSVPLVNVVLKVYKPNYEPASGFNITVGGPTKIFSGTLNKNATVKVTNLPGGSKMPVIIKRGEIIALNKTLELPITNETITYNLTIPYRSISIQVVDMKNSPLKTTEYKYIVRDELENLIVKNLSKVLPGKYSVRVFVKTPDGNFKVLGEKYINLNYNSRGLVRIKVPSGLQISIDLKGFKGNIELYYVTSYGSNMLINTVKNTNHVVFSGLVTGNYMVVVRNNIKIAKPVTLANSDIHLELSKPKERLALTGPIEWSMRTVIFTIIFILMLIYLRRAYIRWRSE